MKEKIKGNYINGNWIVNNSLEIGTVKNPSDLSEIVGHVQWANETTVKTALEAANIAFQSWRKSEIEERITLANLLIDAIFSKKNELANVITSENGKTIKESISEINAAIEESKFHIGFLKDNLIELDGKTEIKYCPIGVVLTITPWNFPLATIMRKIIPAFVSGNTVIVKPSEYAPLTAIFLFKLIDEIGFPKGVLNFVNGIGKEIGSVLTESKYIKAISFTGSNDVGKDIFNQIAGRDIRFQAEMGGSNAIVVLEDADLELAVSDIISNAYACAGQWCTGTSRVIAQALVYDELINRLKVESAKIKIGNGIDKDVDMGPVSNDKQFYSLKEIINKAIRQGAKVEIGDDIERNFSSNSYFIKPFILSNLTSEMDIFNEEVFGPVIIIHRAKNLKDSIEILNNSYYGLSASIYTNDDNNVTEFIDEVECGLVHINLPTAYREYSKPFLGWKSSGLGIPECGRFMLDLFTKPKVIYKK